MKKPATGAINGHVSAAGNFTYPGYVVRGGSKNLMIDAGMNLLAPLFLKTVKDILGHGSPLDYIFITHSHYDHLGSIHYLKRFIPGLITGAHERVSALLRKESALDLMNRLSEVQRGLFADIAGDEDLSVKPMEIELSLRDGDEFDLGGLTCRVYEVPGHTRDSLAFFIPEIDTLFPGEAVGVPQGMDGSIPQVEFLASYDDYLASLERLMSLNPHTLCIGHGWVFTGEDAAGFLRSSHAATFEYRALIEQYLDRADGDVDKTVEAMTRKEYDEKGDIYQERNAYIANLKAQVRHIAGMMEQQRSFA